MLSVLLFYVLIIFNCLIYCCLVCCADRGYATKLISIKIISTLFMEKLIPGADSRMQSMSSKHCKRIPIACLNVSVSATSKI